VGIDVDGWIEVRPGWSPDRWTDFARLYALCPGRSYDAFGCLFGVRNYAGFRPVATGRGVPPDATGQVRQAWHAVAAQGDGLWPTWIGWDEIEAVDWDEPARRPDARLHQYRRDRDGHRVYAGKSAGGPRQPQPAAFTEDGMSLWPEGGEWDRGDVRYRAVTLTRRQAIPERDDWQAVFDVMRVLARLHGPANCRLVVWFNR
jgi:hypothetical protein